MSEFRRMITYLYLYEQGAKRHNVGFAKIEKRGSSCLIEIHMKNTGHSTPSIPVYFYARNNQRLPGILIGSMGLSRGTGDFKAVLEEEPFAGTIYSLEDIKGIYLPLSDEVMFVSQWDDNEFVREQFVDLAKEAAAQKEAGKGGQQEGTASRRGSQQGALAGRNSSQQQNPQAGRNSSQQQNPQAGRNSSQQQNPQAGRKPSLRQGPKTGRNLSLQAASVGRSPMQETPTAQPVPESSKEPEHPATEVSPIAGNTAMPEHSGSNHLAALEHPSTDSPAASRHSDANGPAASGHSGTDNPAAPSPAPDGSIGASDLEAAEAAPKRMPSGNGTTPFPSQPEQQPEGLPENWEQKWKFILENYPVMTPFSGDEDTLCVRLELKDIRLLPRPYWYLGNNSFLLHGFFNYRYLILGAVEKSGRKRWFLGIPGIYQNPERVMATLFGFPEFRNEKSAPINTGEFGYWFRYLN